MIRKKVEGSLQRQFLTALITSKPFLGGCASGTDPTLFESDWTQRVARWALEHYKKYNDALGKGIEAVYHSWRENEHPAEDDAEAVHDLLESLSRQYDITEDINVPHMLDEFAKYLNLRAGSKLSEELSRNVDAGRAAEVLDAITKFRGVRFGESSGFDFASDESCFDEAFADPAENLFSFPEDSGGFFNHILVRDALIGVQGIEKRGKSWWLIEFAFRAMAARRKVAMFQAGDLSKAQIVRRLGVRVSRLPMYKPDAPVMYPTEITLTGEGADATADVRCQETPFEKAMTREAAVLAQSRFRKRLGISQSVRNFMVSVHPMGTISVSGINTILHRWRQESNFSPDCVLIDYADILAPENPREEYRHQVNSTWQALRRLSQEWHACVIAPTQANADAYDAKTQTMRNFSNDKRKMAHVTAMLGLNQTDEEKERQIMRLNWLALRESAYVSSRCLWVAQCIPLGMAYVKGAL